jgi:hypothetical protein
VRAESGDLDAASQLQGSGQAYLKEAQSYYASSGQYQTIFAEVSSAFNQLGHSLGDADTVAQKTAAIGQQQLDAQQKLLEESRRELRYLSATYSELTGISDQTTAISALLASLPTALANALSPFLENTPAPSTPSTNDSQYIETLYNTILGRDAEAQGLEYWQQQLSTGALTQDNVDDAIRAAGVINGEIPAASASISAHVANLTKTLTGLELETQIYNDAIKNGVSAVELEQSLGWDAGTVKKWADNNSGVVNSAGELAQWEDGSHADGLDYVPFNGYRAELHQGEMVLTESVANTIRNSVSDQQAVIQELRGLRQEMVQLRSERSKDATSAEYQRQQQLNSVKTKTRTEALA